MTEEVKNNGAGDFAEEEPTFEETPLEEEAEKTKRGKKEKVFEETVESASKTINEAFKQVESLGKALGSALQDRANVVMVRVNNDSLNYLDMLIEADITKSRSESAAFLINEGIKANESLFNTIREITDQITALREQLRDSVDLKEE